MRGRVVDDELTALVRGRYAFAHAVEDGLQRAALLGQALFGTLARRHVERHAAHERSAIRILDRELEDEQVTRIARTEPTLRDMLQQFRHLFDHVIYGEAPVASLAEPQVRETPPTPEDPANRLPPEETAVVKSVVVVESSAPPEPSPPSAGVGTLWDQELRSARRKLEPEGALTGATREVQSGLGAFLQLCHEHGVKVGPWRLQHIVPEWTFGEHPTYGALTIAHWVCKGGQPWKVGIGLFLGRGPAKPRDLATKLSALEVDPPVIDHLILLRPEDDLTLTGKSKTVWQEAEKRGRHARLEPVGLDGYALVYSFPRWLSALRESLPAGAPLPNLADLIQEKAEGLLERVCMPIN